MSENITEIINIPDVNIVDTFALDYMHLVCLGVVKKILTLSKGSKDIGRLNVNCQKLPINVIKHISTNLLSIKKCIPCDFSRKPRGFDELARWKATEFRQFLLYTGIIVIKSSVPKLIYENFLCLSVAMTIFLSPNLSHLSNLAKSLMIDFVKDFGSLYGVHFISHNVHGLIHLIDDYEKFGCLDQIICFKFENYMGQLKKMVRKQDKPLQQVINRYNERCLKLDKNMNEDNKIKPIFKMIHKEGPLLNVTSSPQYRVLVLDKLIIKIHSDADSFVGINVNGELSIVKIVNICFNTHTSTEVVIGRKFELLENMFEKPVESCKLGIYKISHFSKVLCVWDIDDIITKYVVSTTDQSVTVAIPIIHFEN